MSSHSAIIKVQQICSDEYGTPLWETDLIDETVCNFEEVVKLCLRLIKKERQKITYCLENNLGFQQKQVHLLLISSYSTPELLDDSNKQIIQGISCKSSKFFTLNLLKYLSQEGYTLLQCNSLKKNKYLAKQIILTTPQRSINNE